MIRVSRVAIQLLLVVVMVVHLPELVSKTFDEKVSRPFILYSPVVEEFMWRVSDEFGQAQYRDESGREYDRVGFEMKLPLFYYRDLAKWGELPMEVCGRMVDAEFIRSEMQSVRNLPRDLHSPMIDLFPLFESESVFANLEFPGSVFRLESRMEFVDAETLEIDEETSVAFTGELADAGFTFPARYVAGNPTTRKPFDEGYFAVDATGRLFHFKLMQGELSIVDTGVQPESGIRHLVIRENGRREFYGTLLDGAGALYLLSYDDYDLIRLPLDGFDPDAMEMRLLIDPFHRTFIYGDTAADVVYCVVTDPDYEPMRRFEYRIEPEGPAVGDALCSVLFPFTLETSSSKSDYVLLDATPGGWRALFGIAASLGILALLRSRRGERGMGSVTDWVLVAGAGPCGLVAILLTGAPPPVLGDSRRSAPSHSSSPASNASEESTPGVPPK
jgi:hypothetical protein